MSRCKQNIIIFSHGYFPTPAHPGGPPQPSPPRPAPACPRARTGPCSSAPAERPSGPVHLSPPASSCSPPEDSGSAAASQTRMVECMHIKLIIYTTPLNNLTLLIHLSQQESRTLYRLHHDREVKRGIIRPIQSKIIVNQRVLSYKHNVS